MTASVATYPHEVVRTRLQTQRRLLLPSAGGGSGVSSSKRSGIVRTTRKIIHFEGWRGLYKGLSVNLLRTVPNSAVTMLSCVFCRFVLCCPFARTECDTVSFFRFFRSPQIRIADAPARGAKEIAPMTTTTCLPRRPRSSPPFPPSPRAFTLTDARHNSIFWKQYDLHISADCIVLFYVLYCLFFSLFLFRFLTQTPMSSCMLTVVTLDMAKQYDVSQPIPKRNFKIDV